MLGLQQPRQARPLLRRQALTGASGEFRDFALDGGCSQALYGIRKYGLQSLCIDFLADQICRLLDVKVSNIAQRSTDGDSTKNFPKSAK